MFMGKESIFKNEPISLQTLIKTLRFNNRDLQIVLQTPPTVKSHVEFEADQFANTAA